MPEFQVVKRTEVAAARKSSGATTASQSASSFEASLWAAADALRNNMDAAEYKHVVLGLIFLKYISDAFESRHAELERQRGEGADPEDPDDRASLGSLCRRAASHYCFERRR